MALKTKRIDIRLKEVDYLFLKKNNISPTKEFEDKILELKRQRKW